VHGGLTPVLVNGGCGDERVPVHGSKIARRSYVAVSMRLTVAAKTTPNCFTILIGDLA
jgi:hypothetical protein